MAFPPITGAEYFLPSTVIVTLPVASPGNVTTIGSSSPTNMSFGVTSIGGFILSTLNVVEFSDGL